MPESLSAPLWWLPAQTSDPWGSAGGRASRGSTGPHSLLRWSATSELVGTPGSGSRGRRTLTQRHWRGSAGRAGSRFSTAALPADQRLGKPDAGVPVPTMMTTTRSANTAEPRAVADHVPVKVWSAGGNAGLVRLHFRGDDLDAAGLVIGDVVTLDVAGAIVRGLISKDRMGLWLGTRGIEGWSHSRITDALAAVEVSNPSSHLAVIVEHNGDVPSTANPAVLERRANAILRTEQRTGVAAGSLQPARVDRLVSDFRRCPRVVALVLEAAAGRCELCGCDAPFERADGSPFLEVHHVVTLAEGGRDMADNAVALCPNCHRLMHYAGDEARDAAIEQLHANIARLRVESGEIRSAG